MYLKKIETQGFKSFANKMVLEFRPGIMGIVGPNGSGKSNVADAVRWVLGEQSAKQLRGSNMQDVIFAGTENRKPQGFAYVALTIDNSDHMLAVDYDEVTVSRRVYRSGDSEYRINGNTCRLRDILELFYDTGVGKEGYSIIGQGQIDKILSGKPEDRRELFDEAAGIVKFKKRKNITLKKLESEEGNLARVTDILRELERRVGPLEREADKAKQYLKLRDERKEADIQAFHMEMAEYAKKADELHSNQSIVEADAARKREELDQIRRRYDDLSAQLEVLEEELESARQARSDCGIRRENLDGQLALLEQKIQASVSDEQKTLGRIESLKDQIRIRQEQIEEEQKRIAESEEQNVQKIDQLRSEETKLAEHEEALRGVENEIAEIQQQHLVTVEKKSEVLADLERTKTMLGQFSARSAAILAQLSGSESEAQDLEEQIRIQTEKKQQAEKSLESYREKRSIAQGELDAAEEKQKNNNALLAQENQRYLSVKSHKESLQRLTERYEGYSNSIRKVMEQKNSVPGILGVVADLFHTEEKYETALEIALGGRIQNIVTDTEETAKEMVSFLKQGKLGRATFLPLSSIQARDGFPRPEACREKGAVGIASELVQVDAKYRVVANYLLGRTLVVDNIDHALSIARKYRYSLNIVTLEGDSLTPGGALTGGSHKNNNGSLLGRRREIEQLQKDQQKIQKRLDGLRAEAQRLERDITQTRYFIEQMKNREHEEELEINTRTVETEALRSKVQALDQGKDDIERERIELMEQISHWTALQTEGNSSLSEVNDQIRSWEEKEDSAKLRLEEIRDERERCDRRLQKYRQDRASYEQAMGFIQETIDRLTDESDRLAAEREALEEGIAGGDEERTRNTELQMKIRADKELLTDQIAGLDSDIREKNASRDKLIAEQRTSMDARDECSDSVTLLEKDMVRIQNSLDRVEEQENKLVSYIWEEYEMTPSEAEQAAESAEQISLTEARRRVNKAKAAIKELGPVNVNSIEEFKEVGERYTFTKAQHEDLVRGADQLRDIIRDLDDKMRRQFREKFEQIQVEFDRVFKELFGGGKGSLELGEAEDVLDAGILINAQPPGKKLQNMMQLSGGEKALSAIALLFAIQNLKPSPFCLLDEIEAALDEPNVDRYAAYLNRLKDHTQFIVITHRRGTMEMADRLYGITMQEKGVSALVSVDLTDSTLIQ